MFTIRLLSFYVFVITYIMYIYFFALKASAYERRDIMKKFSLGKLTAAIFIISLLAVFTALSAYAVTADPFPQTVTQPDGTSIIITGHGDEYFNWVESEDGYIIKYNNSSSDWRYAYIDEAGSLAAGAEVVGAAQNDDNLAEGVRITRTDIDGIIDEALSAAQYGHAVEAQLDEAQLSIDSGVSGVKAAECEAPDMLVILIEYNDISIKESTGYWYNKFFGDGSGTVRDYYNTMAGANNFNFGPAAFNVSSVSETNPSAAVASVTIADNIAKVKLNRVHPGDSGYDIYYNVITAYNAIRQYIDFSHYSAYSGGGYIRTMYLSTYAIIAGWEGAASGNTDERKAWSTTYYLPDSTDPSSRLGFRYTDGSWNISSLAYTGEIFSGTETNPTIMGIGAIAHETGHLLGLPDLYDYGYDSIGLGPYSLMASGNWGAKDGEFSGQTPVALDAWSRIYLGFNAPDTINKTVTKSTALSSAMNSHSILKLTNTSVDSKQYYLVENRQLTSYDEGLAKFGVGGSTNNGGILVYQVDEAVINSGGRINSNKYHKAVDILEADGNNNLDSGYSYVKNTAHFFTSDNYALLNAATAPNTNFHTSGHTAKNGGSGDSCEDDNDCHPRTVVSGISLKVLSPTGASMNVVVNPVAVTGVTVTPPSVTLYFTHTITLTAIISPSNATNKSVTWASSDTAVATVSSGGVVTAKSVAGTANITVTTSDGGKTSVCVVTVEDLPDIPVAGVTVSPASVSVYVGNSYTLAASVSPSDAENKSVSWSSSDEAVATVSARGVVKAVSAGTAEITATTNDGGKTATCVVTVTEKPKGFFARLFETIRNIFKKIFGIFG